MVDTREDTIKKSDQISLLEALAEYEETGEWKGLFTYPTCVDDLVKQGLVAVEKDRRKITLAGRTALWYLGKGPDPTTSKSFVEFKLVSKNLTHNKENKMNPVECGVFDIRGTKHYMNVVTLKDLVKPKDILRFVRQPENEYDTNAIAILKGDIMLGHLPKETAKHLAPMIDNGLSVHCYVLYVNGLTIACKMLWFKRTESVEEANADPNN